MRGKFAVMMAVPVILAGTATGQILGANTDDHQIIPRSTTNIQDDEEEVELIVSFNEEAKTLKNEEGANLLTQAYKLPNVRESTGNILITSKINTYYEKIKEQFEANAKELLDSAKKDYEARNTEQRQNWNEYEVSMKYEAERTDYAVLSFVRDYYEYTGGAHPNSTRYAENFSKMTGEKLTFKDIVKDEKEAKEIITNYLSRELRKTEYRANIYEDFEERLPELITDDNWYLSDEGLVIIVNEQILGPHAFGIHEFTIPYSSASFLENLYRK